MDRDDKFMIVSWLMFECDDEMNEKFSVLFITNFSPHMALLSLFRVTYLFPHLSHLHSHPNLPPLHPSTQEERIVQSWSTR